MPLLRKILLIGATCLAITLPMLAKAADLNKGLNAALKGDFATALEELQPLAEAGNARAQRFLGGMHLNGFGTPQDYQQAFSWYQKAAEQGDAQAQRDLGWIYEQGLGLPQDYKQALTWYQKAAEQGNIGAQSQLGLMHHEGKGTPQNFVLGYMWYNISAANGSEVAIKNRDLLLNRMTPAQIQEGQRLSRECIAKNYKNCP